MQGWMIDKKHAVQGFIACPCGPSIQTVSVKKTKHLELSESFWVWLCFQKTWKFLGHSQNFTDTIWMVQGVWVFSRILFWDIEKRKMDSWTTWTGY